MTRKCMCVVLSVDVDSNAGQHTVSGLKHDELLRVCLVAFWLHTPNMSNRNIASPAGGSITIPDILLQVPSPSALIPYHIRTCGERGSLGEDDMNRKS